MSLEAGTAADPVTDPIDEVAALLAGAGGIRRRMRALLFGLDRPRPLDGLIRVSGLAHRTVEELLAMLGTDVTVEGDRYALRPDRVAAYRERFGHDQLRATEVTDPWAARLADRPGLAAEIDALVSAAPPARWRLDQVAATADTQARRALWLDATYDLADSRLLCVGDHDLTSLAVCAVNPAAEVTVVDVDEELLRYIDGQARARGWSVRCRYADLRFGLPAAVAGWADLVFTDPPYTPAGTALFALRGVQGLRDHGQGRVIVAYGFGDRQPALGLKVQRAMQSLHLAFEAILPGFNRYDGAQAVGSASDLYVCRPTAQTSRLADRPPPVDERIYTQGPRSLEAGEPPPLDPAVARAALSRAVRDAAGEALTLVGPGWPADAGPARVGLDRVLTRGTASLPPARAGRATVVAANLTGDPGGWLTRTLLGLTAQRLVCVVDADHPDVAAAAQGLAAPAAQRLVDLVAAKYAVETVRAGASTLVVATARSDGPFLPRWVLDRAHGRLANVWREGLIQLARRDAGTPCTKNEARRLIAAATDRPDLLDGPLVDVPVHLIPDLLAAVAATSVAATSIATAPS